jgi:acyl-homoserine-lactone acylase
MTYARIVVNKAGPYITDEVRFTMNLESFPAVIAARDRVTPSEKIESLKEAVDFMNAEYGTWKKPMGEVFRYQRINDHPTTFDDSQPSLPVRFLPSFFGSLPAAGYRSPESSDKQYLTGGNSFVAVIEFGEEIKAKTIVGGGQSSHPDSPHYTDQAEMYLNGELKDVFFKRAEVMRNKEREYHPGE